MDFEALYAELRTLIAATWPDVVHDGRLLVFEAEHVETLPFDTLAQWALPYAVLLVETAEADWGIGNVAYELRVQVLWVGETAKSASLQRTRAQALAAALWPADPLTEGQVLPPAPRPVWSNAQLPINRTFRAKKMPCLAGGVLATLLVGDAA